MVGERINVWLSPVQRGWIGRPAVTEKLGLTVMYCISKATLACYVTNNWTLSTGNRKWRNCQSDQLNVSPLWIQVSDKSSWKAVYYCNGKWNLGQCPCPWKNNTTYQLRSRSGYRSSALQKISTQMLLTDEITGQGQHNNPWRQQI